MPKNPVPPVNIRISSPLPGKTRFFSGGGGNTIPIYGTGYPPQIGTIGNHQIHGSFSGCSIFLPESDAFL